MSDCRPPKTVRDGSLHWLTINHELITMRWRDGRWLAGAGGARVLQPAAAAASGYRYVCAWAPASVPTEEEAAAMAKSMSALRRQTQEGRDEKAVQRRKKRFDRLTGKQFNRVILLSKDIDPVAMAEAEAKRVKGVTWMALKMFRDGKIDKAEFQAAERYRNELDIANGISDASRFTGAGQSAPVDPGGTTDRRLMAGDLISQADDMLGRDARDAVRAVNIETSMNALAATLRCGRDMAEIRVRMALERLDRHWSRRTPTARKEEHLTLA